MALNFPDSPGIGSVFVDNTSGFSYEWDGTVWQSFTGNSANQIKTIDDISSSFNNITTAFTLQSDGVNVQPVNAQQLRVVLGGITQNPGVDYTISGSTLTFTTAPPSGATFSGVLLGTAISVTEIADGTVTPNSLSAGGPSWNTSGDVYISGITTANNGLVVGVGLTLGDNVKLNLGDDNDLQLLHDGTNSIIDDVGTGSLVLRSDTSIALRKRTGNENILVANPDGSVAAFYANTKRLETTNGGALVYGTVGAAQTALIVEGDIRTTGDISGDTAAFSGDFSIADKIVHTGDTNTAIRFPAADTITAETSGTERLRITSDGKFGLGTTSPVADFVVSDGGTDGIELQPNIVANTNRITNFDRNGGSYSNFRLDAAQQEFLISGSEKVRLDSSGRLLVGTSSNIAPDGFGSKIQVASLDFTASITTRREGNNASCSVLNFVKTRSTSLGGNTIVQNGDLLGGLNFYGADGTDTDSNAAFIRAQVDGTPGANDMPGRLVFSTTADGASSPTERMRIGSAGQIGLGGANYGTSGQVITSNGSGSAPTWQDAGGGAWNLLSTTTASAASTIDINSNIDSTYDTYVIKGFVYSSANNAALRLRLYENGTVLTSFLHFNAIRSVFVNTANGSVSNLDYGNQNETFLSVSPTASDGISNDSNEPYYIEMELGKPSESRTSYAFKWTGWMGQYSSGRVHRVIGVFGCDNGATSFTNINGIRLFPSTGTLTGTFKLYGIS